MMMVSDQDRIMFGAYFSDQDRIRILLKFFGSDRIIKFQYPHNTAAQKTEGRAGRAGGPCFQMKNVNFWRAAQKTEGRAALKGSPPARPFPQTSLLCSPLARPVVQHALLCSSSARRKFNFFIWQHGPPARPARRPSI